MQTLTNSSHTRPVITQVQNNTTLWVGHLQTDPTDHYAGQTFLCPDEGQLDNIQLFSSSVQCAGEILLTIHEFDPGEKTWGPQIGSSSMRVEKGDDARWIRFVLPPVQLYKGHSYGFRVQAHQAMVAFGEAARGTKQPFTFGHEWSADSTNTMGNYYTYFSLAFKVEMRA